jgi:hypothetical protein
MTKVACHGPIISFVIIFNHFCVAMWHIVNGMMETLPLTLTPAKWDRVTHGDSNFQNTNCICNYIVWSLGCHMAQS